MSNLIRWFPDRKGLATGMALTAFGGGAAIAAPINEYLLAQNRKIPEYLGSFESVKVTVSESGKQFATVAGEAKEVVVATAQDLVNFPGAEAGVYVVGTGDTGAVATFATLGAGYFSAIMLGALLQRVPNP